MENKRRNIADYKIIKEANGERFRFFCEASGGAICTTGPIRADTPEEALTVAWNTEGKKHFNRCGKCGRWICNAMTNADTLECVDCSPWENPPRFCPSCGKEIKTTSLYCSVCGIRLMYGGRDAYVAAE